MESQTSSTNAKNTGSSFHSYEPHLVGTTGQHGGGSVVPTDVNEPTSAVSPEHETTRPTHPTSTDSSIYFKSLQWSADGTTLLTTSADCTIHSFVLPPTLLTPPQPHPLKPYIAHALPEPAYATTLYPFYNLTEPSTCLSLASLRNLPIRLYSCLGGGVLGSYPLVSPTTEAFIAPNSLHFGLSRPNQFFAGSNGIVALFDMSRPGEEPVDVMRTGRKRRARSGSVAIGGEADDGLRGIVSTMDTNCDGTLAAGTFSRNVGLYGDYGHCAADAIFSIDGGEDKGSKGSGITQVKWDESGRYLCVAERCSDGISIWDIRVTRKRLAWLQGRRAKTQQRIGIDVMNGEVWAGGSDGIVRVWEGLGMKEGAMERDWQFTAHDDVVNGIGLHPGGTVLATCSGQRHFPLDERQGIDGKVDSDSSFSNLLHASPSRKSPNKAERQASEAESFDNSLKVWAL